MTTKTKHPCHGRPKSQIDAFENIAINQPPPCCHSKTVEALLRGGLIVECGGKRMRDALGEYVIPQYAVPIHHHAQWCAWAAENAGDDA